MARFCVVRNPLVLCPLHRSSTLIPALYRSKAGKQMWADSLRLVKIAFFLDSVLHTVCILPCSLVHLVHDDISKRPSTRLLLPRCVYSFSEWLVIVPASCTAHILKYPNHKKGTRKSFSWAVKGIFHIELVYLQWKTKIVRVYSTSRVLAVKLEQSLKCLSNSAASIA